MKLSAWAKKQGISYRTAWRWYKNGTLPVDAEQLPSGTILVSETNHSNKHIAAIIRCYSRKSNYKWAHAMCGDEIVHRGMAVF